MKQNEPLVARLDRFQQRALIVGIIGVAACIAGYFVVSADQFLRSYLLGFMFFMGLTIGSFGIYMLHHMVGGAWGFLIRRILSAATRTLPLLAILFIPIALGVTHIYQWAGPDALHDVVIQKKAPYLNVPFFYIRAVIYFVVWIGWSFLVFSRVKKLEESGDLTLIRRMQNLSAGGILILFLTFTAATIDWVMSIEPHWYSTTFGLLFIVGSALNAFAFSTVLLVFLSKYKPMSDMVRPQVFNDLGNLIFAFTMLWTYISFAQLLIIYAGNISSETPWYQHRFHGGWQYLGIALVVFHFAAPFLVLLARNNKRNTKLLGFMAGWIIFMRLMDVWWNIAPSFYQGEFHIHWLDLAAPLGIGGIWLWFFFWQLKRRPLLLTNDPRMQAAIARVGGGEALVRLDHEDLPQIEPGV